HLRLHSVPVPDVHIFLLIFLILGHISHDRHSEQPHPPLLHAAAALPCLHRRPFLPLSLRAPVRSLEEAREREASDAGWGNLLFIYTVVTGGRQLPASPVYHTWLRSPPSGASCRRVLSRFQTDDSPRRTNRMDGRVGGAFAEWTAGPHC
ncbi:hypothetical protein Taro_028397, partial [Colocasia esculenta]|nr:hypothetical protein [Colocasia esculenta]